MLTVCPVKGGGSECLRIDSGVRQECIMYQDGEEGSKISGGGKRAEIVCSLASS